MEGPFFSILVTTYNRGHLISRCVDSCLAQTFTDFELVVVDDGSADNTQQVLARIDDPRLHVVTHDANRGISPARRTAVEHAKGEWLVICDSDDELYTHTLERLHVLVQQLPAGVKVLRSRLEWDDGRITPEMVPEGKTDYLARIRWREALAARGIYWTDAGYCLHRSVFERTPFFATRRGAVEILWELDLARHEPSYFVSEVLHRGHADAPNSHNRGYAWGRIPQLLQEAPDVLWMAETALNEHGQVLEREGPRQRHVLVKLAAAQSFLVGDRRKGIRYSRESLREDWRDPLSWGVLALGAIGPRTVALGTLAHRRLAVRNGRGSR
jgi:glycosyltransferase involved in cell wall biosynthesis